MNRSLAALVALCLLLGPASASLGAQDAGALILTYQRNFARSSLGTKLELLKEAADRHGPEMGPLYETALRFVIENAALLGADAQLREVALVAVGRAGAAAHAPSAASVWSVFQLYPEDAELRAASVRALAGLGKGQARVVADLEAFLAGQNALFRAGARPEYPALEASIEALGLLGSGGSFPVLFASYVAGYGESLSAKAAASLAALAGDYLGFLKGVLEREAPLEKKAALEVALANPGFGPAERGELAEAALKAALDRGLGETPVDQAALRGLRAESVRVLRDLKWQRASGLVVRHYRNLLSDYNSGKAEAAELLAAVSALGAMGSSEAAQALALHLQLINARMEQGGAYDEGILVAVIEALGELGDKVAFDYLLYIGYLQYPDTVKRAAREALQKLKW